MDIGEMRRRYEHRRDEEEVWIEER